MMILVIGFIKVIRIGAFEDNDGDDDNHDHYMIDYDL